MKLFDGEVLIDEIPKKYNPIQKIFLSHVLPMAKLVKSKSRLPNLVTTKRLALHLLSYFQAKGDESLTKQHFILLKPYKPVDFTLKSGLRLTVLACEAADISGNVMFLIREENGEVPLHCYTGMFTDMHNAVINDEFASWIRNGVDKIYLPLENIIKKGIVNFEDEIFKEIKEYLKMKSIAKVQVIVADIGHERFVHDLGKLFPGKSILDGTLPQTYLSLQNMNNFVHSKQYAKIIVTNKQLNINYIRFQHRAHKFISIKLTDESQETDTTEDIDNGCFKRQYSPYPNCVELRAIRSIISAKQTHGIINKRRTKLPKLLKNVQEVPTKELRISSKETQQNQTAELPQPNRIDAEKRDVFSRVAKARVDYLEESSSNCSPNLFD